MRWILLGNYGTGNFGDEMLREWFLVNFPDVQWTVVSAHPRGHHEVARLPLGLRSFCTFTWLRTISVIRRSDGIVFGGGSLLTDIESCRACFLWGSHAAVAWLFRRPVILAFQGIGPFRTSIGEWIARCVVGYASSVSVRDPLSFSRVRSWFKDKKCIQSFDPIFSFKDHIQGLCKKNVFIIIPRKNSPLSFWERARFLAESRAWSQIRILRLQEDHSIHPSFFSGVVLQTARSFPELLHGFLDADLVLTQRYHGALCAHAAGKAVEIIPQYPGDKLDALQSLLSDPRISSFILRERIAAGAQELRRAIVECGAFSR